MTGSVRSWIHYIDLRSANGTQKEHMDIALSAKEVFCEQFPAVAESDGVDLINKRTQYFTIWATYPVINTETGEQKEVKMSVHEWDQWREDNPDWTRDYSDPSTMPGVGEVGEWKDKLNKSHPGWNDVLRKAATRS